MFADKAIISVKAGDGGNGIVSFRHEKYVEKGGPDGGDGGKGGDVVFVASNRENTLANFRHHKEVRGKDGASGSKRKKRGKSGDDVTVAVPVGTVLTDLDGTTLADLDTEGKEAVIAKGGKGGFGNAHFKSSKRQAPRIAEKGEPGDELQVTLELKMIADVGLVGLPNAGKSTLLSVISNARPEIANYPFTTTRPHLGVVDLDDSNSLLFADIPGLIEGASQGKGLGDEFLRHVERTRVLVHLIDGLSDTIKDDYSVIQKELREYRIDLSSKPQIIVLNKIDALQTEDVNAKLAELKSIAPKKAEIFAISAQAKTDLQKLLYAVQKIVQQTAAKAALAKEQDEHHGLKRVTLPDNEEAWNVEKTKKGFVVTGKKIERFAVRTDFDSFHAEQRLRDIMRKMGIMHELKRQGAELDDTIYFGKQSGPSIKY